MADQPQSLAKHGRYVPLFHFVAGPILLINLGWVVYDLFGGFSVRAAFDVLVAFSLVLLFVYGRGFALKVQDRVIRLEMRLRMRELLPEDLQGRIHEFTPTQMVALRFAGDAELPALARKVLDENLTSQGPIKQLITDWQSDFARA